MIQHCFHEALYWVRLSEIFRIKYVFEKNDTTMYKMVQQFENLYKKHTHYLFVPKDINGIIWYKMYQKVQNGTTLLFIDC